MFDATENKEQLAQVWYSLNTKFSLSKTAIAVVNKLINFPYPQIIFLKF